MTDNKDLAERVNAILAEARSAVSSDDDPELLVLLLHRAAVELNKSARARSTKLKGTPDWGAWAGLQNTTRGLVLRRALVATWLRS